MSLTVPEHVISQAREGSVDATTVIAVIRESWPFAWAIFERLAEALAGKASGLAIHAPDHMEAADREQLLRAMASTSGRGAVERHFGYVLAFQNCHITGATRPEEVDSDAWKKFISIEAQLLQQQPHFRDC